MTKIKHSAGLVLYRMVDGRPQVLIAHMGGPFHAKKDAGHWTIPKGEYEEDEEPKAAAAREFSEELGKAVPDGEWQDLGMVKYKNGKEILAWALEGDLDAASVKSNNFELEWPPRSGRLQEFPEIDRAGWFSLEEASTKLIPALAEFLERLAEKLGVDMSSSEQPSGPAQGSLF